MSDADKTTRPQLAVERRGSVVILEIRCADVDMARTLYARAIDGAKAGMVRVDLETVARPVIDGHAGEAVTLEPATHE